MAHKKAAGSTSNGRDSQSQRLGVKLQDGQFAGPGCIIVRQRGTRYYPGQNVARGNDDTLFSKVTGLVKFSSRKMKKFNNRLKDVKVVSVIAK